MSKRRMMAIMQGHCLRSLLYPEDYVSFFDLYTPFTTRAILWTYLVRLLLWMRLGPLVFPLVDGHSINIGGVTIADFMQKLLRLAGCNTTENIVFVFPADKERAKVNGFILGKEERYFKAAWATKENLQLETEVNALKWVSSIEKRSFHIPSLIASDIDNHFHIVIYDRLHFSRNKCRLEWGERIHKFWAELLWQTVHYVDIKKAGWLENNFVQYTDHVLFPTPKAKYRFCAAHGDLAPWNLRVGLDGKTWVHDWENFIPSAPYLTDPVHFFIQINFLVRKKQVLDIVKEIPIFARKIDSRCSNEDITLALLFLNKIKDDQNHFQKILKTFISEVIVLSVRE
jgi:hypothetical protein